MQTKKNASPSTARQPSAGNHHQTLCRAAGAQRLRLNFVQLVPRWPTAEKRMYAPVSLADTIRMTG